MSLVRLDRRRTIFDASSAELASARRHLESFAYLKLPGLLGPDLLRPLLAAIERTPFYRRIHDGIGVELCAESGAASGVLEFMLNDPTMLGAVAALADCAHIGCFEGRIYRIVPGDGHYDSWHSDVGEDRLLALSINLGSRPYDGGCLQIRRADSSVVIGEIENPTPGDAVLFRIDPQLRHRVGPVTGRTPRTAYAGWFRAAPEFGPLLATKLRNHGG
jgi:hypothetical protein